jgi:hypothetical protein
VRRIDEGDITDWYKIKIGVEQGNKYPNLCKYVIPARIYCIMKGTVGNGENGVKWKFATTQDNPALLCSMNP